MIIPRWLAAGALTDDRFPPLTTCPAGPPAGCQGRRPAARVPVRWVPGPERVEHFTGRAEELARLDRWAADPQVAPGRCDRVGRRGEDRAGHPLDPGRRAAPLGRGCGGCSGGASTPTPPPSTGPKRCWTGQQISDRGSRRRPARGGGAGLLRAVPLLLVLDGLEVAQEGPAGDGFGRLLDGTLREVLAGACQQHTVGWWC